MPVFLYCEPINESPNDAGCIDENLIDSSAVCMKSMTRFAVVTK